MKQKYITPECEIIRFETENVLTTSGAALGFEDEEMEFANYSGSKFR